MSRSNVDYSHGVDSWLRTNADWPFFDRDVVISPTTEIYFQPQALNMYDSLIPTNLSSRPNNVSTSNKFSAESSPAPWLFGKIDDGDIVPKQELTSTPSSVSVAPAPYKGGHARTRRTSEDTLCDNGNKTPKSIKHQSHNQVERKYRENLNARIERLRLALSRTRWQVSNSGGSGVRACKLAVLAGAVAYIHDLEQEREVLRSENEHLKGGGGTRRPTYYQ